jgi:hypothetical protein
LQPVSSVSICVHGVQKDHGRLKADATLSIPAALQQEGFRSNLLRIFSPQFFLQKIT